MTDGQTTVASPASMEAMTATDRCDRCGSQARFRLAFVTGELMVCAHHGRRHAQTLARQAISIHDADGRPVEPDALASF